MAEPVPPGLRHPRHWPTWIGLGLARATLRLPLPWRRRAAIALGTVVHRVAPYRRHIILTNLRLCFKEKSPAELRELARAHYIALAHGLFETFAAWWSPSRELPPHRVEGAEHFHAALARGRGALLFTAHFTTLEICARLGREHFRFGGLFREPNNPVVARAMRLGRAGKLEPGIPFDDLKALIRALRANHAIWYAADQAKRTKLTEILPFFGEPAICNTSTSRIAAMTGCAVVPFFGIREPDGSYLIRIAPALENFPTDDPLADTIRCNHLVEDAIRAAPEQYFWVHKRFKARGPAHPEAYQ